MKKLFLPILLVGCNLVAQVHYGQLPTGTHLDEPQLGMHLRPQEKVAQGEQIIENSKEFSDISLTSDPNRYVSVQAPAELAIDEATFWGRQISEHMLFLHLGLEEDGFKDGQNFSTGFKKEALDFHKQMENFRNELQKTQDVATIESALPLLQKIRAFQIRVLNELTAGNWVGWIFPLFVMHITLELDYLVDKLNGIQYSAADELAFWNRINSEHAAFSAHLLDPSERELFLKADKLSTKFPRGPKNETDMLMKLSLESSKELDQFFNTAKKGGKAIKSVIHPVLLDHVIREGERSIQTLEKVGVAKERIAPIKHAVRTSVQQLRTVR